MMNMNKLADDIGITRAAIADLQSELEILEKAAKSARPGKYAGEVYVINVIEANSTSVAWKNVAESLAPAADVERAKARYSTTKPIVKLTCTAFDKVRSAA